MPDRKAIYTVRDNVAQDLVGGPHALTIHKHDASAIRMFADIASSQGNVVNQHPADFDLICVAEIDDDATITTTGPRVVITGATWLATQQQNRETNAAP